MVKHSKLLERDKNRRMGSAGGIRGSTLFVIVRLGMRRQSAMVDIEIIVGDVLIVLDVTSNRLYGCCCGA
jgi:hypothetical protein